MNNLHVSYIVYHKIEVFDQYIVTGRVARSTFPGYLSSEAPSLLSDHTSDLRSYSSDFLQRDVRIVAVTLSIYMSA